jgi:hypothetical protein
MADATLISDWILAIERGVVSTNASDLRSLYQKYDAVFEVDDFYRAVIISTVRFITEELGGLRKTYMMKPYALHSLFTALVQNKYGIPAIENDWNVLKLDEFAMDAKEAERKLVELAAAHEGGETQGPYSKYVWGCMSTTDRRSRRTARVASILRGLGASVPDVVDNELS